MWAVDAVGALCGDLHVRLEPPTACKPNAAARFLHSHASPLQPALPLSPSVYTPFLPVQVLGNAKGVVAVVLSLAYFRNPVTFYSVFGYAITVVGVVMYSQVGSGRPG